VNSKFSLFSVGFVFIAVTVLSLRYSSAVITWDAAGYYYYLPALFIHNDITGKDVSWMEEARLKYDFSGTLYQLHKVKDQENFLPQYSCGMAILYSPGFFAGHVFAKLLSHDQDGFSPPYQIAMFIWSLCIVLFGLLLLRKTLQLIFSESITFWTILLIGLATNYLIQTARGITTAHTFIFFLYSVILYSTVKWVKTEQNRWLYILAFSIALACLSRPSEIVAILIPLLYGLGNRVDWKKKWKLFFHWKPFIVSLSIGILVVIPQFIFWKITTGHWFYMSYSNPGEGFDFDAPHTINFLFSYRKGWFVYTPLMFIAFFGLIYIWKKRRSWFWPILIFSISNIYFLSSWSGWWYAQCFSQRSMIQSLPVMAILLAALIDGVQFFKWRKTIYAIIALFSIVTISFSWQYERGLLSQDRMTKEYFWKMIGRSHMDPKLDKLLLVERSFTKEIIFKDSSDYELTQLLVQPNDEAEYNDTLFQDTTYYNILHLNQSKPYTKSIKRKFTEWTGKNHFWMQLEADVFIPDSSDLGALRIVCCAEHEKQLYAYFTRSLADMGETSHGWKKLKMDYLSPEVRKNDDEIKTYLWWSGIGSVYVKNFTVKTWEKKDTYHIK
jgi:hypothetical protein